jgi:hypothetical protein
VRASPINANLDPAAVRGLLSQLCVTLGFCLPPSEIERLAATPPGDSDEFTNAVLAAEGYGLANSDPIFQQARELVAQAFVRHQLRNGLLETALRR